MSAELILQKEIEKAKREVDNADGVYSVIYKKDWADQLGSTIY